MVIHTAPELCTKPIQARGVRSSPGGRIPGPSRRAQQVQQQHADHTRPTVNTAATTTSPGLGEKRPTTPPPQSKLQDPERCPRLGLVTGHHRYRGSWQKEIFAPRTVSAWPVDRICCSLPDTAVGSQQPFLRRARSSLGKCLNGPTAQLGQNRRIVSVKHALQCWFKTQPLPPPPLPEVGLKRRGWGREEGGGGGGVGVGRRKASVARISPQRRPTPAGTSNYF